MPFKTEIAVTNKNVRHPGTFFTTVVVGIVSFKSLKVTVHICALLVYRPADIYCIILYFHFQKKHAFSHDVSSVAAAPTPAQNTHSRSFQVHRRNGTELTRRLRRPGATDQIFLHFICNMIMMINIIHCVKLLLE